MIICPICGKPHPPVNIVNGKYYFQCKDRKVVVREYN